MNRNGSISTTKKTIQDSFPIGLVVLLKDTEIYDFRLVSINEYALKYLCIPLDTKDSNADFISIAKCFKLCNINNFLDISLYDDITSKLKKEKDYDSSTFVYSNQIINLKMKQYNNEYYLTIDTISDDRKIILQKLISSIRNNFLMTINHELKNYLCSLITTLEETKAVIEEKDFTFVTVSVLLIQKIVKLYIIYNKTSLDEIRNLDLSLDTKLDICFILLRMQVKFTEIFVNKNIQMKPFNPLKKIIINTEKHYINDLLFVIFFFLYYKIVPDSSITINIDYISNNSSCVITFITYLQNSNSSNGGNMGNKRNKAIKMIESQIKKTVISHDILQYLLFTISKFLHCDISLYNDDSSNEVNGTTVHKNVKNRIISLKLYDIEVNDGILLVNEDSKVGVPISKDEIKPQVSILIEQIQSLSNRNGISEWQFEKKNTYGIKKLQKKSILISNDVNSRNLSNRNNDDSHHSNILSIPYFKQESNSSKLIFRKNLSVENIDNARYRTITSADESNNIFIRSDFEILDDELSSNQNDLIVNASENIVTIGKYQQRFNINGKDTEKNKSINQSLDLNDTTINNKPIGEKILSMVPKEEEATKTKLIDSISRTVPPNINCKCNDIALVDDELSIAKSMMRIIKNQNKNSDYFPDGRDCIEKINFKLSCTCNKRFYKLILLDVYMSEWGGITTCEKINELIQSKTIPSQVNIVFISGHNLSDLDLPKYYFVKGFYQKPVNKQTIIKILQEYYNNKQ